MINFRQVIKDKKRLIATSVLSTLVLLVSFVSLNLILHKSAKNENPQNQQSSQTNTADTKKVLGERTPQIFVSGGKDNYSAGGMIALASTDEPSVQIGGYDVSGTVEVSIYQANMDVLLDYLTHDKDGKQIIKNPDVSKLNYVTKVNQQISSGYNNASKLLLPISESGIWLLRIKYGAISTDSFVIRSNIGTIVKEGDNQYLFWGQNFKTRRSVSDGNIKIYNLKDGRHEIANTSFGSDGIAKTPLTADADIALVQQGEDRAIVPINLRYLNTSYNYNSFQPQPRQTKYFIFTDRPIYRPGDTIYFKSILRDDDDARYTIPTGQGQVKIYDGYGEENVIFDKTLDISADGTINGEYKLPADSKTGYYRLTVSITGSTQNETSFDVEFFRKPEYSIDVAVPKTELIAGDQSSFTISGSYFSGQPLVGQKVKYTVYSSDFYNYEYLTDRTYALNDDYRYGYWGGDILTQGETNFDKKGEAEVNLETKIPIKGKGHSQVFSIEAQFDDGSGNPSFSRKNVLVYAGEYEVYRKDTSYYSTKPGTPLSLPVTLVSHRNTSVSNINLTAKVHRVNWIPYQEDNKKYLSYKKEEEDLPQLSAKSDSQGNATFTFTPTKVGSYTMTIEGKDSRGNLVSKDFSSYVSSEDQPYYSSEQNNDLTIQTDKQKYLPTDTVTFTISSTTPDRDVFLSLERGRVNRYQIVHLTGKGSKVDVPLVNTDIPNIYAKVSSFSSDILDSGSTNVVVSADTKKLIVNVTPNSKTFGPGENITVNLQTTDTGGNPVGADVALWSVDKSLFELVDEKPQKIFDTFWNQRSDNTQEAHSLEGITVLNAEMGGGCFAAGTPVLMADGKTKPIEQVKAGDNILTRESPENSNLVKATVQDTHEAVVSGYFILNGNLKVTSNHKLWVNGSWKEASSIQSGDTLTDSQGQSVTLSSIEWVSGKFTVYNLEVEKYHTYFAGGVWVHNQKGAARQIFKDTAYWNPSIHTDASGRAQVTFKLPDNLTTWVIAAVGSTVDTKVGQTTSEVVVTKDVIVRPILPNILRTGDEIVLSALVQNFTETDQSFDVSLKFDSGDVQSPTQSDVLIKSKETKQMYWRVSPKQENDKSKLTFSAISKEDKKATDTIVQEIPVRAFGFAERRAETGDGSKTFDIKLASDSQKDKSNITFSLAPTILGTLPTAMGYLIFYPYGCVEQTTSRFVPAVIAKSNSDLFGAALADRNVDDIIQKSLSRLFNQQQGDGGWTWWFTGQSDPFITAYVVEYVLQAKQAGIKADDQLLKRAQAYLEQKTYYDVRTKQDTAYTKREDIIAKNYGLTLLGAKDKVTKLYDFNNLSPDILAIAVMADYLNGDTNPQTNGLAKLISMAQSQGDAVFWDAGNKVNFGSKDASTALAIRAILLAGGDRELAVKGARYLTRVRQSDYWSNTYATAQVARALVELSKTGGEIAPNYNYTVSLDGKQINQGTITSAKQNIQNIIIPVSDVKQNSSTVSVSKTGDGQIYSTLLINEFHTDRNAKAVNHGLEVKRDYISDKGQDYSLAVGDTVTVRITVSGLKAEENYGVISDELPSGMVPINKTLKNEQYGQDFSNYYSYDVTDREVTENGMVLSLYQIASGSKTYTYQARVVSEGTFTVPPATASLMYAPEIYGRSDVQTIKTTKESEIPPAKALKKALQNYAKNYRTVIVIALLIIALSGFGILILRRRGVTLVTIKEKIKTILKRRKNMPPDNSQKNQDDVHDSDTQHPGQNDQ